MRGFSAQRELLKVSLIGEKAADGYALIIEPLISQLQDGALSHFINSAAGTIISSREET